MATSALGAGVDADESDGADELVLLLAALSVSPVRAGALACSLAVASATPAGVPPSAGWAEAVEVAAASEAAWDWMALLGSASP